ncbi:MAG: hypothetical protein QMC00_06345, partial [Pseudomonadales bacterium]
RNIVKGIVRGIVREIVREIGREIGREMICGIMVLPCPGLCLPRPLPAPAESTGAWTAFLDHVVRQPALWLVSSGSNDTSPLPVQ